MKAKIRRFEDIIAWQKGRALVKSIYAMTAEGPMASDSALCRQIRKAAISIPANIAEGFERSRLREFHQFLSIAKASCADVRNYVYLAADVGFIDGDEANELLLQGEEVANVIGGLRRSVGTALRKPLRTQDPELRTAIRC